MFLAFALSLSPYPNTSPFRFECHFFHTFVVVSNLTLNMMALAHADMVTKCCRTFYLVTQKNPSFFSSCFSDDWESGCQWWKRRLNWTRERAWLVVTPKIFDIVVKGSALLKFSIDDVQISGIDQGSIILVPLHNRSIIYSGCITCFMAIKSLWSLTTSIPSGITFGFIVLGIAWSSYFNGC